MQKESEDDLIAALEPNSTRPVSPWGHNFIIANAMGKSTTCQGLVLLQTSRQQVNNVMGQRPWSSVEQVAGPQLKLIHQRSLEARCQPWT